MLKDKPVVTLKGHQGPVNHVTYNVNGEYCSSAGDDKTIILWNPVDGVKLKVYNGHGQNVRHVVSSHDNCHLGSASADRCAFYWDVASGTILRRFRGHESVVNCVKFNKSSNMLLSGGNDSTVRIMDLKSRSYEAVQVLNDAKDSITSIDISEDEIVVGSIDGRIRIYDIRMGKLNEDFIGEPITNVCFSSDCQSLVVSSLDNTVRLIDKTSGQLLNDYSGHTHMKLQLQAASWFDDSAILSVCEKSKVFIWDLIRGEVKQMLDLPALAQTLSVHPSKFQLLTGDISGNIHLWISKCKNNTNTTEETKSMSCWALPPR